MRYARRLQFATTFLAFAACGDAVQVVAPAPSSHPAAGVNASVAQDRSILTRFFHATGGHAWNNRAGWLSDKPVQEWFGVGTRNGRVTSLDLSNNNLIGPLPATLAGLDSLQTLSLNQNSLRGPIPGAFAAAPRLRDLFLDRNELSGSLPEALGDAPSLQYVSLSRNHSLRGPLPSSFGQLSPQSFLTDGTALCLPDDLYDWHNNIPQRSDLAPCETSAADRAALVSFYHDMQGPGWTRSMNWLTDKPIHQWYGVKVNQRGRVIELTLNQNKLTGVLPQSLWTLTALTNLELYNNSIVGNIPSGIGQLTQLANLELDVNQLTGSLPIELFALTQLENVELEWNALTGRLPSAIRNLQALKSFEIFQNRLSGPLPPELGELPNLTDLALSINNFSGPIPPELGNLTKLTTLFLNHNRLTGAVPATFGNLVNLEGLFLHSNELSSVPAELEKLTALRELNLSNNLLRGSIPATLSSLTSLRTLDLRKNQLSGSIPATFGDLKDLTTLHLAENTLTGTLPAELGNLARLGWLNVSYNRLHGPLPAELASIGASQAGGRSAADAVDAKPGPDPRGDESDGSGMSGGPATGPRGAVISALSLNHNDFSGRLPVEWGGMHHLSFLDLSGNENLYGVLPETFANLTSLTRLYLGDTDLCLGYDAASQIWAAGLETPWALPPCTRNRIDGLLLREMYEDMGGDGWSDAEYWGTNIGIGAWRGVSLNPLGQVAVLALPNMNITGEMSRAIGRLSGLQALILSGNDIRGRIPENFASLKLLQTINVTGNTGLRGIVDRDFLGIPLRSLMYKNTAVCVPGEAEFDAWITTMDVFEGDRCVRKQGPLSIGFVHVLQAIQTERNDVPLVMDRDVALRIYIEGNESGYYGDVPIRATIRRGPEVLFSGREIIRGFELRSDRDRSVDLDEAADLTMIVPGEAIRPNIKIEVKIDEGGSAARGRNVDNLEIQEAKSIVLTLVPVVSISGSDRSVIEWTENNVESVGRMVESLFGFREVSTRIHDVYVTNARLESNTGPVQLLAELVLVRFLERDDSFWYGVGNSTSGYFRGLAELSGAVGVGKDIVQEAAHEMGHVFGLKHAPCGDPVFLDDEFPYEDGSLGGWAYDMESNVAVDPRAGRDIMGYCYGKGMISDYNFRKVLEEFSGRFADAYAVQGAGADRSADGSMASAEETLVLWGYLDGGRLRLEPPVLAKVRTVGNSPVRFTRGGEYSMQVYEEGGALYFAGNFEMREDAWGGKQFVAGIPTRGKSIEKLVVRGPEGTAEVTVGNGRSVTIVRGAGGGSVRAILRDWSGAALPESVWDGDMPVEIETTVGLERDVDRSGCLGKGGGEGFGRQRRLVRC